MSGLSHLDELEAEAIYIIREVAAECEKPVMLYSIGKDSSVMLHLAMKAFYPEKPPFPFLHVNTTWKFKEMIEFRDRRAKELGIEMLEYINEEGVKQGINPFDHGSAYTDIMKTQALKGMRDLLPAEQTLRDYIQGKILETYRASGFERISTPMLEDMENLDKSDGGDNLKFVVPDLLNLACHLDLYALEARTEELDGIIVPAHVDKQSASLLSVLGCVPDDLKTGCLEISRACPEELRLGLSRKYLLLESSDAHCLEDMCASDFYLELERNDIEGLFERLKNPVL